jgi:GTPase SAR1 family protein
MGHSCSSVRAPPEVREEMAKNVAIDKANLKDHEKEINLKKLLLVGAGESGKSTLFKQMVHLYGKGFGEDERRRYLPLIHDSVIDAMRTLIENADKFAAEGKTECAIAPELSEDKAKMFACSEKSFIYTSMLRDVSSSVEMLWRDPGIQATYQLRSLFQLADGTDYLLNHVSDYVTKDYVPSKDDLLHLRIRTTGVTVTEFAVDKMTFSIYDVGGQRSERKKWIHYFDNVDALLFVAAISEYDQVLFEDESVNRLHEALNLFEEICSSPFFKETTMILFLNKYDLFIDKIKTSSLSKSFPEYSGPEQDVGEAFRFISRKFLERNSEKDRMIHVYDTTAIDDKNVLKVFASVKDTIIRKSLMSSGIGGE